MLPRPSIRLPIWVAIAIIVAAYVGRSAMRGFDFRPDMPLDAVILVVAAVVMLGVWWVRRDDARRDEVERREGQEEERAAQEGDEHPYG